MSSKAILPMFFSFLHLETVVCRLREEQWDLDEPEVVVRKEALHPKAKIS
jgi:hypothetical protein